MLHHDWKHGRVHRFTGKYAVRILLGLVVFYTGNSVTNPPH